LKEPRPKPAEYLIFCVTPIEGTVCCTIMRKQTTTIQLLTLHLNKFSRKLAARSDLAGGGLEP
jgi:hypothetical protein